jgi:hypothetical protein
MIQHPQESHCDLGIVDDDHTEDLRPPMRKAPAATEALQIKPEPPTIKKEFFMSKAQATDVALPIGADPERIDNWETDDGVTSRLVWSLPDPRTQRFSHDVRIVVSQLLDGSIITDDATEEPLVYVDGEDYSLAHARILALALIEATELADRWAAK